MTGKYYFTTLYSYVDINFFRVCSIPKLHQYFPLFQIIYVDRLVHNLTIVDDEGYGYNYSNLCALVITGGCWRNEILDLGRYVPDIEAGDYSIPYPIWFNTDVFKTLALPFFIGTEFIKVHSFNPSLSPQHNTGKI